MAERTSPEVIPNPDPSLITSDAIDRAVANAVKVFDARIDGMQKAVEVFQADLTRVPTAVDRAILGLRELQETRFKSVESNLDGLHKSIDPIDCDIRKEIGHLHALMMAEVQKLSEVTGQRFLAVGAQFSERDTRTDQRAGDTKLAVDAAFAAADKGLTKIEGGFTKQIDGILNVVDTKTNNLAGGLSDLKERFTALESRTQAIASTHTENRSEKQDNRSVIFGVIGALVGVVGLLIAAGTLVAVVLRNH